MMKSKLTTTAAATSIHRAVLWTRDHNHYSMKGLGFFGSRYAVRIVSVLSPAIAACAAASRAMGTR